MTNQIKPTLLDIINKNGKHRTKWFTHLSGSKSGCVKKGTEEEQSDEIRGGEIHLL